MKDILIGIAGLAIYVQCWRKFGFRKATGWAGAIIISILPLTFSVSILQFWLGGLWNSLSFSIKAWTALTLFVLVTAAVKGYGLTTFLAGMFQVAIVVSYLTLVCALLLLICVAVRMPPIVMIVGVPVILVLAKGYRRH